MIIVKALIYLFFISSWWFAYRLFTERISQLREEDTLVIESFKSMIGENFSRIILAITLFISGLFLFINFFAAINGYIYFVNAERWFLYLTCSFAVLELYQIIVEGKILVRISNSSNDFVKLTNRYARLRKKPPMRYVLTYGWAFLSSYLVIHLF